MRRVLTYCRSPRGDDDEREGTWHLGPDDDCVVRSTDQGDLYVMIERLIERAPVDKESWHDRTRTVGLLTRVTWFAVQEVSE